MALGSLLWTSLLVGPEPWWAGSGGGHTEDAVTAWVPCEAGSRGAGGGLALTATKARVNSGPDAELVEQLRVGDGHAVEELVTRYAGLAYRVALRLTRSPEDAEEVTWEVMEIGEQARAENEPVLRRRDGPPIAERS